MSDEDKTVSEKPKATSKKLTKKVSSEKPAARPMMPRRPKVFKFEQWAARRGVPVHHRGGLRAYVSDVHKSRTLEEWDACFQSY